MLPRPGIPITAGLACVFAALLIPHLLSAQTFYVSPSGNDANNGTAPATPKATITAAFTAAAGGDTVRIASGTYQETFSSMNKSLAFEGGYTADFLERDYDLYRSTVAGQVRIYRAAVNARFDGICVSTPTSAFYFHNDYFDAVATYTVTNCRVADSSGTAVNVAYAENVRVTVSSNVITNCRNGVAVGYGGNKKSLVSNNLITNIGVFGGTSADGRGVAVFGGTPNDIVSSNTIVRCERWGVAVTGSNVVISGNRVIDCGWGFGDGGGIDSSNGPSVITNNVVARSYTHGIKLAPIASYPSVIRNNTISGSGNFGVSGGRGAKYFNNIIVDNGVDGIQDYAEAGYNVLGGQTNDIWDGVYDLHEPGMSFYKPELHHNIRVTDTAALFVDAAADDYRLAPNSLAVDAGDPADPAGDEPAPNGGRIDCGAYGGTALAAASEAVPPGAVTDLAASPGSNVGEVTLSWSAPGDDGYANRNIYGAQYLLKYATCSLAGYTASAWWDAAALFVPQTEWLVGEDTGVTHAANVQSLTSQPVGVAGIRERFTVNGLAPGVTYYFMLKTRDNSGNISGPDALSADAGTMARAAAAETGNHAPALGYAEDNALGEAAQRKDGSKIIGVKFRVRDADGASDTASFVPHSAWYTLGDGLWRPIDDAHIGFSGAPFVPAADFSGAEYTMVWYATNTLTSVETSSVSVRFRVSDGEAESLIACTGAFSADLKDPSVSGPFVESAGPVSVKLRWTGSDRNFDQYTVFYDTNYFVYIWQAPRSWTKADDPALAVRSTFTVVRGLDMGTTYWFMVQCRDSFGNTGSNMTSSTCTLVDAGPPGAVTDLTVFPGPSLAGSVRLQWTSPGSDGAAGNIADGLYEIKYSSAGIITAANYASPPSPSYTLQIATGTVPGRTVGTLIAGLVPAATYWFAVKTRDDALLWSVWNSSADAPGLNAGACGMSRAPGNDPPRGVFSGDFGQAGGALYDGMSVDEAYAVAVDTFSAGGPYVYVVGKSSVSTGGAPEDWFIIKYDAAGNKAASQWFNGPANGNDGARAAAVDRSGNLYVGGFIMTGGSLDDCLVVKYNANLDLVSSATFNGAAGNFDDINALAIDPSGNVIAAGQSSNGANYDFLTIKYSPSLVLLSSAVVNTGGVDRAYGVAVDAASNVYVGGQLGGSFFAVLKYSPGLVLISSAPFPGSPSAEGVTVDSQGNVIAAGSVWTGSSDDLLAVKFDPGLSTVLSSATCNSGGNDYAYGVAVDASDNIIVAGRANDDYLTIKYTPGLAVISSAAYNSGNIDAARAVAAGAGDDAYVTGYTGNGSNNDIRTLRYSFPVPDTDPPGAVTDLAAAPGAEGGEVLLTWSAPGDDGPLRALASGSRFSVQYSTASDGFPPGTWDPAFAQVAVSTSGAAPGTPVSHTVTGLSAGTTYYFRLWHADEAQNWSGLSAGATAQAAFAPPSCPSGFAGVALSTAALQWTWTDTSEYESGFRIRNSTGGVVAALGAGTTAWTESGLPANTSWYRYIEAFNVSGSSASGGVTAYTLANMPAGLSIVSVSSWTVSLQWPDNSNPGHTRWGIYRSTDGFTASTVTLKGYDDAYASGSWQDRDLAFSTTYWYKVCAFNGEGIRSAYVGISTATYEAEKDTAPPAGVTDLSALPGAGEGQVMLGWSAPGDDGMSLPLPSGSEFRIQYSSSGDPGVVAWSTAGAQVAVSTAGVTPGTYVSWQIGGLSAGATHYFRLWYADEALNWSPLSNGATAMARIDPPAAPGNVAAVALSTASIRWTWDDAGERETGYRVLGGTGGVVMSLAADATSWIEEGLSANTSRQRCIEAYNLFGSSASGALSRYTLANPPAGTAFEAVYVSSLTFGWSLNGNAPGTRWSIVRSTDNFATSTTTLAGIGSAYTSLSYGDGGLVSNTSYYYRIAAFNGEGIATDFDVAISTFISDSAAPGAVTELSAGTGTDEGEVLLAWTAPGDDGYGGTLLAGSRFRIQYSSSAGAAWSAEEAQVVLSTANVPAGEPQRRVITGLEPGATYYFRLWTEDEAGNRSGISAGATAQARINAPPSPGSFSGAALSPAAVRWRWADPGAETGFVLYAATGGIVACLAVDTTEYIEAGFAPNTLCRRYVSAVNGGGESGGSAPASVYTLAVPPAEAAVSSRTAHSVVLSWPPGAGPCFMVSRSTDGAGWAVAAESTTAASFEQTGLLPGTTHFFSVRSYNGDYLLSASSAVTAAVTLPLAQAVLLPDRDAYETKTETVHGVELSIRIAVPQGALSEPGYIDINVDPLASPREVERQKIIDAAARLSSEPGRGFLDYSVTELNLYRLTGERVTGSFSGEVTLSLPYPDADDDGMVDGAGIPADSLRVYVLDEAAGRWEQAGGTVRKAEKRVEAALRHFSVYALAGMKAAASLRGVTVYPNPYRPGSGGGFDRAGGIVFNHLPAGVTLTVFTLSGEQVFRHTDENSAGSYEWDAKNSDGEPVASGIYIYLIVNRNDPSDRAAGKIGIIR